MKTILKTSVGIIVSILCIALALRQVNYSEMWGALQNADYGLVMFSVLVLMISHYFRVVQWQLLLLPVKPVSGYSLFSALVIGYAANSFLPAHLGEFLRAYVVSKKKKITIFAVLASIVMERLIDILSLLMVMAITMAIYPGPPWLISSGYMMLFAAIGFLVALVLLRRFQDVVLPWLNNRLNVTKINLSEIIIRPIERFLSGITPLVKKRHYMYSAVLSVAIWGCYAMVYYLNIVAFNLDDRYSLPWYATSVVLAVTTISIIIPSSPGYVGTFHYLCQLSLAMFGVNAGEAFSYATVVHMVSVLPVTLVGLILANIEGLSFLRRDLKSLNLDALMKGPVHEKQSHLERQI